MDVPAALVAQTALTRQTVALSVIRQNAEAGRQLADMIDQTIRSVPVSGGRGANVDLHA